MKEESKEVSEQKLIALYEKFRHGKTDAEIQEIRHEMMRSSDNGNMAHFTKFLGERYGQSKANARKIYKCLYHETWIGDLKNEHRKQSLLARLSKAQWHH